ncbi:zinc finger protein OZF-like [Sparus aurata]|uniref:Zinc finger protein OZF-like n=1 Tax=Sparus aurata TaxID=8175 RepID=A0A671WWQ1_SPAAU|nr:zinc finger protein OZF-like [Sparus aurata]
MSRQFLTECFWRKSSCESVKMSKVQTLRVFMKQRLTAAAEEIFELFERTIAEYEEELCRQRKLLDAVTEPQVQLHRTDVQKLLESKEEDPPEQQERSTSMDQEDPPELPHIKEEQEELWTRQEGEQLPGLEEADIKFTLSPVPVKSEEDEEKPQSSQLHQRQTEQMETEADGEDCGGPEPDRTFNSVSHLQPVTDDETSHCCEPETDHSSDWETRKHQVHSEEQGSSCSVCKKKIPSRSQVVKHMRTHKREKRFRCSVCGKIFSRRAHVTQHLVVHTSEKPFSCSLCGKKFTQKSSLYKHLKLHAQGKLYTCSICQSSVSSRGSLKRHMSVHSEEKQFSCSVCGKGFRAKRYVKSHMTVHTEDKHFCCSVCGKRFARKQDLNQHSKVHMGEKPFSCSVCRKGFARNAHLKRHSTVHGVKTFP